MAIQDNTNINRLVIYLACFDNMTSNTFCRIMENFVKDKI